MESAHKNKRKDYESNLMGEFIAVLPLLKIRFASKRGVLQYQKNVNPFVLFIYG